MRYSGCRKELPPFLGVSCRLYNYRSGNVINKEEMKYTLDNYKVHGWAVKVKKWYGWVNVKTYKSFQAKEALELFNLLNK